MKRLLLLAALCVVRALAFAPAALAQGLPLTEDENGMVVCPDEATIAATVEGDPGEGSLMCFATQEEADAYRATGQMTSADAPDSVTADAEEGGVSATAEGDESASATASPEAVVEDLPDTGGVSSASLTVLPALLLVGSGVTAVRVIRRS